jgi:hypothetical protein
MCRSFISLVDNARELQASIAADEAADWTCVFERDSGMTWEQHGYTALAGVCMPACALLMMLASPGWQPQHVHF